MGYILTNDFFNSGHSVQDQAYHVTEKVLDFVTRLSGFPLITRYLLLIMQQMPTHKSNHKAYKKRGDVWASSRRFVKVDEVQMGAYKCIRIHETGVVRVLETGKYG